MKTVFLVLSLFILKFSLAQDTVTKDWKFTKQIELWNKWQNHSVFGEVSMPDLIRQARKLQTYLPVGFDSITDNPLRHGASYLALRTRSDYKNRVYLFADLYAEHRGVSYGLFNQENTIIYPIIRLEAKDSFHIFSRTLSLYGRAGQFLDERMDEGLMIYNIDLQGMQLQACFEDFVLQYTLYGDLFNGIGLAIDDLEAFSLSRKLPKNTTVGVSWVSAIPPYNILKNNYTFNLFASKIKKNVRIYSQIGYRPFDNPYFIYSDESFSSKLAFVAGINRVGRTRKLKYVVDAALRYYGFVYNKWHYDVRYKYRDPATDVYTMYANTVGDYLYPLRKFETPYSQWAAYTEYGDRYNVASAILSGNLNYRLVEKFATFLNCDFNYVYAKYEKDYFNQHGKNSSWLYPFFNLGLEYVPVENVRVKGAVTNKSMNLDLSYPTLYQLKRPCFELSMTGMF